MKKILALVLALMLVLGMTSAMALELNITDSRTGRTYEAYQILTGDISGTEGSYTLADMKWGNGQTTHTAGTALTESEQNALPGASATRDDILTYLEGISLASSTTYTSVSATGGYKFENLPAGWYVIKETTVTEDADDFTSAMLVQVVGNTTATIKGSKTTVEKKVDDINDSTGDSWTEKDSADHDIGDTITFTLTATLGNDLTDYETYTLQFVDNLSKGLTYAGLTSLTVGGESVAISNVTVADGADVDWDNTSEAYEDGTIKTFTIADVLTLGAEAGDTVVIKYTATLNSDAVIGSEGNPNKVYLKYSNNPDSDQMGKTGEDINKVFTYKGVFDKYTTEDSVKKHLSGAQFKFFKVASNITDEEVAAINKDTVVGGKILKIFEATVTAGKYEDEEEAVPGSVFTFSGLDDGVYVLVETVTPTGYNTIANQKYTVSATHSETAADPELLTFTGNMSTGVIDNTGVAKDNGNNANTDEILNNSGSTLPSTGGIGTTLFYVGGGILILLAVVLLVTKRRMNGND